MPTTPFDSLGSPDWTETQGATGGAFTDSSTINDSRSVTFHFRCAVPASPVGILIEAGATGDGMGLAFDGSGQLVGAAGKGNTTSTDNDTVFASMADTDLRSKTVDIYWCIRPTAPGRAKIYAFETDGTFIGLAYGDIPNATKMGTQDPEGDWTGSNNYGIGVDNNVRSGISTAHFNGTMSVIEAWDNFLPSDFDDNTYNFVTDLTASGIVSSSIIQQPAAATGGALLASSIVSASHNGTPAIGQTHAIAADDAVGNPALGTPDVANVTAHYAQIEATNGGPSYHWLFNGNLSPETGGASWTGSGLYASTIVYGDTGQCLNANGSEWNLANQSDINDGNQTRESISLWIEPDNLTGTIWEQGGSTNWHHLYLDAGTLYWSAGEAQAPTGHVTGPVLSTGTVYHIVAEYDAPNDLHRLYVNGTLYSNATNHSNPFPNHTGDISLAGPTDGGDKDTNSSAVTTGFDGRIAQLAIWANKSRLLTSQEVTDLYESGVEPTGDALVADSISSASEAGSAALGQEHALTATDLTGSIPALENATLGQEHGLTSDDLAAGAPALGTPFLGQEHVLSGDDVLSGAAALGEPILSTSGSDGLVANDLISGAPVIDSPLLGQEHVLSGSDLLSGAPTLENATLGQEHALTSEDALGGVSIDSPVLGHIYTLSADGFTAEAVVVAARLDADVYNELLPLAAEWGGGLVLSGAWGGTLDKSVGWGGGLVLSGAWGDTLDKSVGWGGLLTKPVEWEDA